MLQTRTLHTPIGVFEITGSELGLTKVQLSTKVFAAETALRDLPEAHPVRQGQEQMQAYFEEKRTYFDIKLDWSGAPEFHQLVWAELLKIPFGITCAYSDIAERLNNPNAVRAVGMANRSNPIAIIVPCHRVIGKAGELRGYFYGLDTKMLLLRHENPVKYAEQGTLF